MEADELTMEEKCENLMNIVVESRKRFGKMCVDYAQKSSLVENKLLNFQIDNISHIKFKSIDPIPTIDVEDMNKDIDEFAEEILQRKNRAVNLRKKIKDTLSIIHQLKQDSIGKKVHQPLSAEVMLALAKKRQEEQADAI